MAHIEIVLACSIILNILLFIVISKMKEKINSLKPVYITKRYNNKVKFNHMQEAIINNMSGEDFEKLCCDVLALDGFKDFRITRASGDFGIDVLCKKGSIKYGVQCKCYSQPVGVHAVEEVYAGCAYYGCDIPMVMTSNYFTDAAKEMARVLRVDLRNKSYLYDILHKNGVG